MLLFTGPLPNEPEIKPVNYTTHSVSLNILSITKGNPDQVSELDNTQCLILLILSLQNDPIINLL